MWGVWGREGTQRHGASTRDRRTVRNEDKGTRESLQEDPTYPQSTGPRRGKIQSRKRLDTETKELTFYPYPFTRLQSKGSSSRTLPLRIHTPNDPHTSVLFRYHLLLSVLSPVASTPRVSSGESRTRVRLLSTHLTWRLHASDNGGSPRTFGSCCRGPLPSFTLFDRGGVSIPDPSDPIVIGASVCGRDIVTTPLLQSYKVYDSSH